MAAFVDDVRASFDAAHFCRVLSAGVGIGKTTSGLALRDASAVSAATAALHSFLRDATSPSAPDVVAAYVQYSPAANELFTALRAITVNAPLVALALDCLSAVVRYAHHLPNPAQPREAARAVVKEVVKTRAVLLRDVLAHDQPACAKKALVLLALVAQTHPVLAKEVLNRFNFADDDVLLNKLCSTANNFCRVPFLALVYHLLASGDFDVACSFALKNRPVLVTCLTVVTVRVVEEAYPQKPSKMDPARDKGKKKKHIPTKKRIKKASVLPSHVQREELNAAINFLTALQRHLLALSHVSIKRAAFAFPVLDLLAQIAAADIPPLEDVPHQVVPEHRRLRKLALELFQSVAMDSTVSYMRDVINALTNRVIAHGIATVEFVLNVIDSQPRVAKGLLERGKYVREVPQLSSSWFGTAAVISACVLRLPCAITKFAENGFFTKCLSHEDPLIRNTGITIMNAFCKVIQADREALARPETFLPSLDRVQYHLKTHQDTDGGSQKLLSVYQELLCDDDGGTKADPVKISLQMAGNDLEMSEHSIRAAFSVSPCDALSSVLKKGYFAKLIIRAAQTSDKAASTRLWRLSHEILMHTGLFPTGTENEVDIFLSLLSKQNTYLFESATALEKIAFMAWSMPFRLYDDLHSIDDSACRPSTSSTSLFTVASVYRLRKLTASENRTTPQEAHFRSFLESVLTTNIACQRLMGSFIDGGFLDDAIRKLGLGLEYGGLDVEAVALMQCQVAQRLFTGPSTYMTTPYLKLIQAISLLHLQNHKHSESLTRRTAADDDGFVWKAWQGFREGTESDHACDPFGTLSKDSLMNAKAGIHLGTLLHSLREGRSEGYISKHLLLLRRTLTTGDFMLSLGFGLRVGQGNPLHHLMRTAAKTLAFSLDKLALVSESESFLQESMLVAVNSKHNWTSADVDLFIAEAIRILNVWKNQSGSEERSTFAFSLILRLVKHEKIGARILSRARLRSESIVGIPSFSSMPLASAILISHLVRHFPALTRAALTILTTVTENELAACLQTVFPLVGILMRKKLFQGLKADLRYNHDGVCKTVINAVATCKQRFVTGNEKEVSLLNQAACHLGEALLQSDSSWESLIVILREAKAKGNVVVLENVWMLLASAFHPQTQGGLILSVPNLQVVEYAVALTEGIAEMDLHADDIFSSSILSSFHDVMGCLRKRKIAVYSVWKDVAHLEKSLTLACSNLMKYVHQLAGCCVDGKFTKEPAMVSEEDNGSHCSLFSMPLLCVSEALGLDLVLDKAAKRSLLSLGAHNGDCLIATFRKGSKTKNSDVCIDRETGSAVAFLIQSALLRMPRYSLEEEVATALSITEGVLASFYGATSTSTDVAIRNCMDKISDTIRNNGGRSKLGLLERRTGFFAPSVPGVLSRLDKKKLQQTCNLMLDPCTDQAISTWSPVNSSSLDEQARYASYDPVFVLRTFFCACTEAKKSPGTAVLDIGRIARDGVLAVALTGIATHDQDTRALSFACLHQFSSVVGPVAGVEQGSAAGLYKDRRQLAFLLELLQNSFQMPMPRILPLFAVWFQKALKIALAPAHEANKAVTFFFLRSPCMDVSDCLGLSKLFNWDSSGPQLSAVRLLAMDIVKRGTVSAKDVTVLKKRKVFDALLRLGGSAATDDQIVRDQALETLATLFGRTGLQLGQEVAFSHGIVPWLLQDAGQVDEPDRILRTRVNLLHHICTSSTNYDDGGRITNICASALAALVRRVLHRQDYRHSRYLLARVLQCTEAIAKRSPCYRQYLTVDFSPLCLEFNNSDTAEDLNLDLNAVVFAIARQRNMRISPDVYPIMLRTALTLTGCEWHLTNREVFDLRFSGEIFLIHAFIAQSLLQRERTEFSKRFTSSDLCLSLANSMNSCPSVWLTIASFRVLENQRVMFPDLLEQAHLLPALPSDIINPSQDQKYIEVVDRVRLRVVDNLILASSTKTSSIDSTYFQVS